VEKIERIPELFRRAVAIATSGRPGPVVIDLPEDISHEEHLFDPSDFFISDRYRSLPATRTRPEQSAVEAAARAIAAAANPVILAGGGVHISQAHEALTRFARDFNIPVAHTLSGKGAIACSDPLSAGLFGRYDRIANGMIAEADVLLVIGCKLGEVATKRYTVPGQGKKVIHLELVAEEIGRTLEPEIALWGDARCGLEDLHAALAGQQPALSTRFKDWGAQVPVRMGKWRKEVSERLHSEESPINIARLLTELNEVLPSDAVLIADGGFAAHWGGLLYDTKKASRGFVADRGFASIGYGLPAAMGASLAAPGRAVVALTGDGGFNMSMGDLETAKRLGTDCVIIVLNNAASGYIKSLQHLMYGAGSYHASDLEELDYAAIASAFGCNGIRVERPEEIAEAVRTGLGQPGPTIIDMIVTRDPAKMLPGVDSRTQKIRKGDRIA
jgi:acetolactate synthase-1/2/3 large subunit